jgi:hypothetical protein
LMFLSSSSALATVSTSTFRFGRAIFHPLKMCCSPGGLWFLINAMSSRILYYLILRGENVHQEAPRTLDYTGC